MRSDLQRIGNSKGIVIPKAILDKCGFDGRRRLPPRLSVVTTAARHRGLVSMNQAPIRRALLSVWDKADLIAFARGLAAEGVELSPPAARRARCARPGSR